MKRCLLAILTLCIVLQTYTCLADVLHLKNGDRLTGTIVNMEDTKLTFWTKYAGEITLFWQDVERFEMDDSSKIVLKVEPPVADPIEEQTPTQNSTETTEDEEPEEEDSQPVISPDNVLAINPKPIIPVKITARANAKLTYERGNTDKDVYYINGEFIARTDQHRYAFDGHFEKEKKSNYLTEENWLFHGKLSHFTTKEIYLYGDTLFEGDKFKDLKLRSTYGGGAGYQFVENEQVNLSFSMGLAWVTEEFYGQAGKEFIAGQWAIDFDRYLYREAVQFFHSDKGYVSLENSGDWFVKSKTGFRFPLYKGFTATIQYEYDWDNEIAIDAETEEDAKFMFLLGYRFKN